MDRLGPNRRLLLHQLRLQIWADREKETSQVPLQSFTRLPIVEEAPSAWRLTHGVALYPWQEDTVKAWMPVDI